MVNGFGLRPYRNLLGAGPTFLASNSFGIAYNNSHTIGEGDIVIPLNTGYLDIASNSPSNPVLGVFANCAYANPINTIQPQTQRSWTAPTLASTTTVSAQYYDDPQLVFAVVASASLTQSAVGFNANFLSNGTPNTSTGISTLILDASSLSTASNYPLRIVEFAPIQGNTTASVNPIMGVTLNTAFAFVPTGI